MYRSTKDIDGDPSFDNRRKMSAGKEETRRLVASFLRVTPEQIVLTRNTSEANNMVAKGLDLKAGDEVIVFADNHPSNNNAWTQKAKRFGYAFTTIGQPNPHPGPEYYLDAVRKAITSGTRLLAFTHHTSTVGDVLPAKELCLMARERGVMTLVDGACTFGMLDLELTDIQPDFYTGSSHKWPCGPKEVGVLFVSPRAQASIHPSIISAYPGAIGISRTLEALGQRDEPAIIGFGEAITFQTKIGRKAIEERSRSLGQALIAGLRRIDGVQLWTHPDPSRSGAVVSFRPGTLDVTKLSAALYDNDRMAAPPVVERSTWHPSFTAHLQHDGGNRSLSGGNSQVHASRSLVCARWPNSGPTARWKTMNHSMMHVHRGFGSVRPYLCGPTSLTAFIQGAFGAEFIEQTRVGPRS